MNKIIELQNKLESLRKQLFVLENEGLERIRQKRMLADMDDDFRENEGAKLVMEDHNLLHLRIFSLKNEIFITKKMIVELRSKI